MQWGASSGPSVVLPHGWERSGAQLGFLMEPLVEPGHRVLAADTEFVDRR